MGRRIILSDENRICNWKEDDSIFSMRLGLKIRFYRRKSGLSQKGLAELVKVSNVYISQAETGRFIPALPMFVRICNALAVSPGELLSDSLYISSSKKGTRFQNLIEEYDSEFEDMAYTHLKNYLEDLKTAGSRHSHIKEDNPI